MTFRIVAGFLVVAAVLGAGCASRGATPEATTAAPPPSAPPRPSTPGASTVSPPTPPVPSIDATPPSVASAPVASPPPADSAPVGGRAPVESAPLTAQPPSVDQPAPPQPPAPSAATPEPSLDTLADAVRLDPGDAKARLALGAALVGQRDLPRAIEELREALRLLEREHASSDDGARAAAHLAAGQARIARGDMAGAAIVLREALGIRPDLAEARASLGLALYGMGNLDGAIDELRAVLRQQPTLAPARLTLAAALAARQDWPGARAELEQVAKREPNATQAHLGLGIVRYALGDLGGAIDSYRRALAQEPAHHDARYALALVLKLAGRDAEAADEMLAAARAGIPKAQYFLGAAYAAGVGVERDLGQAVAWWFQAAEHGVTQAEEALAQLRAAALGRGRRAAAERQAAEQAFRDFRAGLWTAFPALAPEDSDSVGATLLRAGLVTEAVPVLIREALALGETAQQALETLYEQGVEGRLAAHDARILACLTAAAAEGQLRARLAVARIHARGLGVPQDVAHAIALLRATPHERAQRLLRELAAGGQPAPARP